MKVFVVLLLAIVGTGFSQNPLSQDLLEFVDLLPEDKLVPIIDKYTQMDEFLEVVGYMLFSDEFKEIVLEMETVSEYLELLKYLDASGLEIYEILSLFYAAIGLPPPSIPKTSISTEKQYKSNVVNECRNEIRAIFPKDKIAALHTFKLNNSQPFKYFADRMYDPQASALMTKLKANPIYQKSIKTLNDNGLDMDNSLSFYAELFGFI